MSSPSGILRIKNPHLRRRSCASVARRRRYCACIAPPTAPSSSSSSMLRMRRRHRYCTCASAPGNSRLSDKSSATPWRPSSILRTLRISLKPFRGHACSDPVLFMCRWRAGGVPLTRLSRTADAPPTCRSLAAHVHMAERSPYFAQRSTIAAARSNFGRNRHNRVSDLSQIQPTLVNTWPDVVQFRPKSPRCCNRPASQTFARLRAEFWPKSGRVRPTSPRFKRK